MRNEQRLMKIANRLGYWHDIAKFDIMMHEVDDYKTRVAMLHQFEKGVSEQELQEEIEMAKLFRD